jgi:hypothetical protein
MVSHDDYVADRRARDDEFRREHDAAKAALALALEGVSAEPVNDEPVYRARRGITTEGRCCYITDQETLKGCENSAEWQIEVDNQPLHPADAFTHACSEHVGLLLWEGGQHRVFPIDEAAPGYDVRPLLEQASRLSPYISTGLSQEGGD